MGEDFRSARGETLRWLLDRSSDYLRLFRSGCWVAAGLGTIGTVATAFWSKAATRPSYFLLVWGLLAGLGTLVILYLLASAATRRGDPFLSRGFKLATQCLLPSIVVAGAALFLLSRTGMPPTPIAALAAALYGSVLLATTAFAPRPIRRLGWSFVGVGLGLLGLVLAGYLFQIPAIAEMPAWICTGIAFVLLHLLHPLLGSKAG